MKKNNAWNISRLDKQTTVQAYNFINCRISVVWIQLGISRQMSTISNPIFAQKCWVGCKKNLFYKNASFRMCTFTIWLEKLYHCSFFPLLVWKIVVSNWKIAKNSLCWLLNTFFLCLNLVHCRILCVSE